MSQSRSQLILTLVGAIIALLAFSPAAQARGRNDLGLSIGASAGYTDNVRGSKANFTKQSSASFVGELGATYTRHLTFGDLSLDAGGIGTLYTHDSRWNQIFGLANAELMVPITNRLHWRIRDQFRPAPVDFTDIDTSRSNQTQTNRGSTSLEFTLPLRGRWNSKIRGSFARLDIIDVDNVFAGLEPDRYETTGEFLIERQLGQRWSLGVSTYFGRTMFIKNLPGLADTTGYGGSVEASYSPRSAARFFAGAGYGRITSSILGSNKFIWSVDVDWQIFKRLRLEIEGQRAHTVTLNGANAVLSSVTTKLEYKINARLTASLAGVWLLSEGISFIPGKEQVMHVSPSLSYLIGRRYKAALSYGFTRNGSDDTVSTDFTRNNIFLSLSATF